MTFTFKSFVERIRDELGGDPVAAALDVALFQGTAPGNLDREVESFRKALAVQGYSVVSEKEYRLEIAQKLRELAGEAEYGA